MLSRFFLVYTVLLVAVISSRDFYHPASNITIVETIACGFSSCCLNRSLVEVLVLRILFSCLCSLQTVLVCADHCQLHEAQRRVDSGHLYFELLDCDPANVGFYNLLRGGWIGDYSTSFSRCESNCCNIWLYSVYTR